MDKSAVNKDCRQNRSAATVRALIGAVGCSSRLKCLAQAYSPSDLFIDCPEERGFTEKQGAVYCVCATRTHNIQPIFPAEKAFFSGVFIVFCPTAIVTSLKQSDGGRRC